MFYQDNGDKFSPERDMQSHLKATEQHSEEQGCNTSQRIDGSEVRNGKAISREGVSEAHVDSPIRKPLPTV